MLYVKMMSDENLPDDSPYKGYEIIPVGDRDKIKFGYLSTVMPDDNTKTDLTARDHNTVFIQREDDPEEFESYPMKGNVYIMNAQGKTIASGGMR